MAEPRPASGESESGRDALAPSIEEPESRRDALAPSIEEPESGRDALPPSMRDRVPFLLYRAAEQSHSLANDMLAQIELNARQVGILTLVIEREPMTQKALGDMLRIDRTTMVALIDDLERKGLVVRQRHPRDRRAFLVSPTESGRTAKVEAIRILDEQQRCFLAPLAAAERQQLGALLKRLQRPPGQPATPDQQAGD